MTVKAEGRWGLSREALDRLLGRLSPDREAAAREYEVLRRKLVDFFDMRRAPEPEALADETLDRVARRLDEGEAIEQPRAYCYGVAKLLLLESGKRRIREQSVVRDFQSLVANADAPDTTEARVDCLERCLKELPEESRELIVEYYQGPGKSHLEGRKLLAERLRITYVTLKTRAHRIRARLEECLGSCLGTGKGGNQ